MSITKFIKQMGEDANFREKIGLQLLELQEGDWESVVQIAEQEGFKFSKEELVAAIPKGFFKGNGQNPEHGWDISTLKK